MRIACIIMAHKEPLQLERLLKKFDHPSFEIFIHLDKKVSDKEFLHLARPGKVSFIQNRMKVRWASYSFLQAVLNSFREVLDTGIPYDFLSVMSGQDYPIIPVPTIYERLAANAGRNFISFEEGAWWDHAITRVTHYHFTNFDFRGRYLLQRVANTVLPRRKFPFPFKLYGGPRAMCMTLSRDCARYVVDFFDRNPKLRRFGWFTWGPDEFMIPTIIMNSAFRETVVNDNFYYIDWSGGGANPKTLTVSDFQTLVDSGKMFARKFDIDQDAKILDMIDRWQFSG